MFGEVCLGPRSPTRCQCEDGPGFWARWAPLSPSLRRGGAGEIEARSVAFGGVPTRRSCPRNTERLPKRDLRSPSASPAAGPDRHLLRSPAAPPQTSTAVLFFFKDPAPPPHPHPPPSGEILSPSLSCARRCHSQRLPAGGSTSPVMESWRRPRPLNPL